MFACEYGWNVELSKELRARIQDLIFNGTRADLYDFLQIVQTSSTRDSITPTEKVLWPTKNEGKDYKDGWWEQAVALTLQFEAQDTKVYTVQNRFIYLESLGAPSDLCTPAVDQQPCLWVSTILEMQTTSRVRSWHRPTGYSALTSRATARSI